MKVNEGQKHPVCVFHQCRNIPLSVFSCHGGIVTCNHANGECFSTVVAMTAVHAITSVKSVWMEPLKTVHFLGK